MTTPKCAVSDTKDWCGTFDKLPGDLVEAALTLLYKKNITPLIPWGSLLFRRLNVPKVLLDFQFLVPDELLSSASDMVSTTMHLPLTSPPSLLVETQGDLITKGRLHRLTRAATLGSVQFLHLVPLSFAGPFLPSELTEERHETYTLSIPRPSAVYASLLRIIASCPRGDCPTRRSLGAELELLVNYHLLGLPMGYRVPAEDDDEAWDALDLDGRAERAVCTVRGWGVEGEWREGEGWMQDALVSILRGTGDIDYLPWTDRSTMTSPRSQYHLC
ncbi:hypothetical protein BDY19DRAFT_992690 [Irpex rosettiformis]|uniref:Uncharacterized protein n=1 Tax=Irpex rosettiformis TaxID=378272 RepID=A0ACB8U5R8_9APHY|nr:hypothetical protein BDY19DRAFT_992690 [Irpex rosettiformis]